VATLRQILANRRNAALSSGPKTAVGKAHSKLNARRHGLAAQPDPRTRREIEILATVLVNEFGTASISDVQDAARAQVNMLRVREARMKILDRIRASTARTSSSLEAEDDVVDHLAELDKLERYERRARSKQNKAFRALHKDE
jgi:hypothetical protein